MYKIKGFEKISYEQWEKDTLHKFFDTEEECKKYYDMIELPKRSTAFSAGYDFKLPVPKVTNFSMIVPTGVKICIPGSTVLFLYSRSSLAIKHNIVLANSVGVIDSDYYNNEGNEGHIMVAFRKTGNEDFELNYGDKICQGVIQPYLIIKDDESESIRRGGIGSTGN